MKFIKELFHKNLSIVFIIFIWLLFSSPFFISGKVPMPSTFLVNFFSPWSDYPGFSSPVKNNAMPDIITQIYPWKNITIDSFRNLQIPFWNPYSFSGTPHLANYQSAVFSPFNLLFLLPKFIDAWSILVLLQTLLAGIFMYLCLRAFKISKNSSVLGSVSFMFCGFITVWLSYATLAFAILFLPLSIYCIEKFYETFQRGFLVILSLTIPLSFFSGHFQISLYFLITVILFTFYKYIAERKKRNLFWIIFYIFAGVLFSLPQVLPSLEQYGLALRSGIFEKLEAIPFNYLPTFLAPDFYGNPVTRNDWFGHYAEWNGYIGVIPLMLLFYAIGRNIKKNILFFLLLSLFALLFAFSSPFLDLLIWLRIPVISTSAASRVIVLFSFAGSVLAAFGLDKLVLDLEKNKLKRVLIWFSSFGLLFLSLWLVVLFKLFLPIDKILIARQNLILPSVIFLLLGFFILLFAVLNKKTSYKKINLLFWLLTLLTVIDLLRFSVKWMPFENKDLVYPNVPVSSEFNKISGKGRVLGNIGGEASNFYKLDSLEGYDALYLKKYGEFIAFLDKGKFGESQRSVVTVPKNGIYTKKAIDLLNVKYIIYKVSDGRASWTFPFWNYKKGVFTLLYNDSVYQVLQNEDAYPRVFLVNKYSVESSPQNILNRMFKSNIDLRKEIVLEADPKVKLSSIVGTAKIISNSYNKIEVKTQSSGNSFLFLSDTYYPGWEAYVDNRKTEILRADYTFRTVFVPKGEHTVQFEYKPQSFNLGVLSAGFALIGIVVIEIIKKRKII